MVSNPLLEFISIEKMRLRCAEQFENHWQCLERHNQVSSQNGYVWSHPNTQRIAPQEYYPCRKPERALSTCMFDNFVRFPHTSVAIFRSQFCPAQKLTKKIPGSPEGQAQIHEVEKPIFKALQK
jgi:NADH dehydrogenase (ubiquinone) 1 alpha subcomplex subunit 8